MTKKQKYSENTGIEGDKEVKRRKEQKIERQMEIDGDDRKREIGRLRMIERQNECGL